MAFELLPESSMNLINPVSRRNAILFFALVVCLGTFATELKAQTSAQERANDLRAQLLEAQAKKEGLEARQKVLEEESRPENIEKSLAGFGSTRPEDVRELRRRQLEAEKTSIQNQLKVVAESEARLESGVRQAETAAYHQSAATGTERQVAATTTEQATVNALIVDRREPRRERRTRFEMKRRARRVAKN